MQLIGNSLVLPRPTDLNQVHIDDYMFSTDVLLMIIAQTANPSINPC